MFLIQGYKKPMDLLQVPKNKRSPGAYRLSSLGEPLFIYFLLFASGIVFRGTYPVLITFSLCREIIRIFSYTLPSLGLILYLLYRHNKAPPTLGNQGIVKPRLQDLRIGGITLLGLGCIGFCIAGLPPLVNPLLTPYIQIPSSPRLEAPQGLLAWLVILVSCLGTGYLEESYFRLYLLLRLEVAGIGIRKGMFLSCILFSICHAYEGPWGILHAALAGILLSLVFIRHHSFHGIAWAHGAYNGLVYLTAYFDR
jgi:membrane protease YdiL (CAAX protease family)